MGGRKKGSGRPKPYGEYYQPIPVDMAVISMLPDEGAMLGWNPLAYTAQSLVRDLNKDLPREQWITVNQLTGRLTSMKAAGLVITTRLLGGVDKQGWQRTQLGVKLYEKETGKQVTPVEKVENIRKIDFRYGSHKQDTGGGEE